MKFFLIFLTVLACLYSLIARAENAHKPADSIKEVVIFQVKNAYSPSDIVRLAQNVTSILKTYPGFQSRNLSEDVKNSDNWIDIVQWKSLKDAKNAARRIVETTQMKSFMASMVSYQMYHFKTKYVSAQKSLNQQAQ